MEKTKEELYIELKQKEAAEKERLVSDARYAVKLVEIVVWSLLATIFLGLVAYFFHLNFQAVPQVPTTTL